MSLLAKSPSFVSMSNPVVSKSSLPAGYTRSCVWMSSVTTFLPLWSLAAVMYPVGLLST